MPQRDAYLLSPYRPPTSYPVSLDPDEAAAWLAGYFALWHPAVLAAVGRPPQPASAYDHDPPADGAIYAVPDGPHLHQSGDWNDRVTAANGVAVRATPNRDETRRRLLDVLRAAPGNAAADLAPLFDAHPDAVRAFAGLGFGYLVVDALFDAAGHDRLLDADGFWADVSAAVRAVPNPGGQDETFAHLRAAADKLRAAREGLNANAVALLDTAIPAEDALDAPWPDSLRHGLPLTVIAAGELLERMHANQPARLAQLKVRNAPGLPPGVDLVCGGYREREDAVLPPESQWWNLAKGRGVVAELFGEPPAVYGRHRTALHAQLPGWLHHAGFRSAVMANVDGALVPTRNAAVVTWPGPDGRSLDAFAREPHPASDPLTFFNLGYHLHRTMTADSAPVLAFAHRGTPAAIGYDELLAVADLGGVLGSFTGLADFLRDHHSGEYLGTVTADDFFTDYLDDRVNRLKRPDAVSGFAALYRLRRRLDSAFALAALHRMLTPPSEEEEEDVQRLEKLEDEIESRGAVAFPNAADNAAGGSGDGADTIRVADVLGAELDLVEDALAFRLAARIQAQSQPGTPGLMVFNQCGFARRIGLELDPFPVPIPVEGPVKAAQFDPDKTRVVVEVPALGFAWVPRPERAAGFNPAAARARIKTAEGTTVRNEFFEAELDPATGGLRSFRDTRTRVPRIGMQLAFNPGSKMRARDIRVTLAGPAAGEVVAEGEILDDHDHVLAGFRHTIRAWVGRPALEMTVEFEPNRGPTGYPWHAYYAARFAWRDERSALFRGVNGANVQTHYTRPGSPDYLEVRHGAERTFVFTGGLPFAQRHGARMIDVVLIPEGEKGRRFDLLLAADRDYPMATAAGWCAPAPVVPTAKGQPPGGASGWLGHLDLPSLLLTGLRPEWSSKFQSSRGPNLSDDLELGTGSRAVSARFLECAGFGGTADLRFAKPPARATAIDGDGCEVQPLSLIDGAVPLEFSANEVIRVRAEW